MSSLHPSIIDPIGLSIQTLLSIVDYLLDFLIAEFIALSIQMFSQHARATANPRMKTLIDYLHSFRQNSDPSSGR